MFSSFTIFILTFTKLFSIHSWGRYNFYWPFLYFLSKSISDFNNLSGQCFSVRPLCQTVQVLTTLCTNIHTFPHPDN